jgi:nucleotide-binding universal stress UspA family protein
MFRTIVVPLDHNDEAEAAVPQGAALARQAGAQLQLLTVSPAYVEEVTVHGRLREIAERQNVDAQLVVLGPDDVAETLSEIASQPQTLLCLRTHARGPVAEMVMGSVSEQVVRMSHQPVLMIGPRCEPPPERYESLVVGLDGSELAEQILPTVGAWATDLGLTPWLFQVLSPRVPLEIGDDVQETGYVHKVANRLADQGVKAEWEIVHDHDAAAAIVRFARAEQPALIGLTTHGRSGLGRVALGGVAFQVAHHATCPVLVLRPSASPTEPGGREPWTRTSR